MRTLAEIEAVVDSLTAADKQELLLFVAARIRAEAGRTPDPRTFSREQIDRWVAEDEAAMKRARTGDGEPS